MAIPIPFIIFVEVDIYALDIRGTESFNSIVTKVMYVLIAIPLPRLDRLRLRSHRAEKLCTRNIPEILHFD